MRMQWLISVSYTHLEEDLSIDIDTQEDFKFSIILKFQQDESGMQEIRQNLEKNKIILSCKNFKDEGTGTPAPVDIVEIDGKKMYFMFWSFLDLSLIHI